MINKQYIIKGIVVILFIVLNNNVFPYFYFINSDTNSIATEKIKKGWTFGALPAISYDSDIGFRYGGLVNFYNYGDGSTYPKYLHSLYLEISRTTKGNGTNQFFFDSENIFPDKKIRITSDISYLTEKALNFYGFNGYKSKYKPNYEDDNHNDYISRMYYRYERKMIRFTTDFQGEIINNKIRWLAGVAYFDIKTGTVDINNLNKGRSDNLLPDTTLLYDKFVEWDIISEKEKNGNKLNLIKLGLIYDTRDNEANPNKGIWTELLILKTLIGKQDFSYTKLIFTHRQYYSILPNKIIFAYRLAYQGTISGKAPFYIQPYIISSYSPAVITEGLGGARSLRGILRNRIVGDAFIYGNIELRNKIYKRVILNQNVNLVLNLFLDTGKTVKEIEINKENIPVTEELSDYFDSDKDNFHSSIGFGLNFALNENFIIAVNYGKALDKRDGNDGLYVGLNFLF
ncbi:MAG: BamA/TamA family outer membrane protein [Bacteroidales bacterium]|nr:BamA/TamA family outer membrane protein [Bacteroidales bacterium]